MSPGPAVRSRLRTAEYVAPEMVVPEPLRWISAVVVPPRTPGPDTSSSTIRVALFTVVGCPSLSRTLTSTVELSGPGRLHYQRSDIARIVIRHRHDVQ